jgi:hypothetical protein
LPVGVRVAPRRVWTSGVAGQNDEPAMNAKVRIRLRRAMHVAKRRWRTGTSHGGWTGIGAAGVDMLDCNRVAISPGNG